MDSKSYVSNFLSGQTSWNQLIEQQNGLTFQLADQTKNDFLSYPIKNFLEELANEIRSKTELGLKIMSRHKKIAPSYPKVFVGKQYGSIICSLVESGWTINSRPIIRITVELDYFKVWVWGDQQSNRLLIVPKNIPKQEMLDQILNYLLS